MDASKKNVWIIVKWLWFYEHVRNILIGRC